MAAAPTARGSALDRQLEDLFFPPELSLVYAIPCLMVAMYLLYLYFLPKICSFFWLTISWTAGVVYQSRSAWLEARDSDGGGDLVRRLLSKKQPGVGDIFSGRILQSSR